MAAPILYAHRGSAIHHRENTAGAFDAALALGFQAFELDLLRLGDDTIVVYHDFTLSRQFKKLKRLSKITLSEFRKINNKILTFEEFVRRYSKKDITVNFEIKDDVRTLGLARAGISKFRKPVVSSFRLKVVDAAAALGLPVGYLFDTVRAFKANKKKIKGQRIHVSKKMLAKRHKPAVLFRGYELHVYTVNDPAEARQIAEFDFVKGIFTDTPEVLHAF
ncbi:MAG: hypothetical protein JNM27_19940 [Leptospirales bacterium]|nr:hypothetical protein [Leptospirales bacterium]